MVLEAWAGVPAQNALAAARELMPESSRAPQPSVGRLPAPSLREGGLLSGTAFVVTVIAIACWASPLASSLGGRVVEHGLIARPAADTGAAVGAAEPLPRLPAGRRAARRSAPRAVRRRGCPRGRAGGGPRRRRRARRPAGGHVDGRHDARRLPVAPDVRDHRARRDAADHRRGGGDGRARRGRRGDDGRRCARPARPRGPRPPDARSPAAGGRRRGHRHRARADARARPDGELHRGRRPRARPAALDGGELLGRLPPPPPRAGDPALGVGHPGERSRAPGRRDRRSASCSASLAARSSCHRAVDRAPRAHAVAGLERARRRRARRVRPVRAGHALREPAGVDGARRWALPPSRVRRPSRRRPPAPGRDPFAGTGLVVGGATRPHPRGAAGRRAAESDRRERWPPPSGSGEARTGAAGRRHPAAARPVRSCSPSCPSAAAVRAQADVPRRAVPAYVSPHTIVRARARPREPAAASSSTRRTARRHPVGTAYRRAVRAAQDAGARVLGYVPRRTAGVQPPTSSPTSTATGRGTGWTASSSTRRRPARPAAALRGAQPRRTRGRHAQSSR